MLDDDDADCAYLVADDGDDYKSVTDGGFIMVTDDSDMTVTNGH